MIAERDRGLDLELVQLADLLLGFHEPQEFLTGGRLHDAAGPQEARSASSGWAAATGSCRSPEGGASTLPPRQRWRRRVDAPASGDLVRDEHIGHRQQRGAADQEHAAVEQREPPANRGLGVTQPRTETRACVRGGSVGGCVTGLRSGSRPA